MSPSIYFTMQICGLDVEDLAILPKGPLLAFLLVQNGGYLVAFTAGGQTLGKMAAGIRVVPADSDAPLDLGRAFLRTLMWVRAGRAGRSGLPDRALQPRSPRPARSLRRHARRSRVGADRLGRSRQRSDPMPIRPLASLSPPCVGVGYVAVRPGTFGSAVGLLLWVVLLGPSAIVQGIAIVAIFGGRRLERRRRASGTSAAPIPAMSSSTKSWAC